MRTNYLGLLVSSDMRAIHNGRQFAKTNLCLLFIGFSFLAISACTGTIDTAKRNQDLVERWFQVWNTGDLASSEEIFATDFVNHDPNRPEITDFESCKAWVAENRTAFPDFRVEVQDMIAEGDKVASRWTVTGIHKGRLSGVPPTSVQVTMTGMNIHRLVDGRIVEAWWSYDMLGMMQQLGVIPPMPDAPLPALYRKPEDYLWSPLSEVIGDPGDPDTNKDLVLREELEGWKQGSVSVALEAIAPNFVNHDPVWPAVADYQSYVQWVESELTSPLNLTVDDLIAEGDKVAERVTVDLGEGITESVMIFRRFADGRIAEKWWSKDAPWGHLGLFVDGVSIPDSEAFLQREMHLAGPGNRIWAGLNPHLVLRQGRPVLAGNSIGSGMHGATLQGLSSVLDGKMELQAAIEAPVFHGPYFEDEYIKIGVQKGTFSEKLLRSVEKKGQYVLVMENNESWMHRGYWIGLSIDPRTGERKGCTCKELNGYAIAN